MRPIRSCTEIECRSRGYISDVRVTVTVTGGNNFIKYIFNQFGIRSILKLSR